MSVQAFRLAIMLARVCVSEAGFDGTDECTVIVHALVEQAHQRGIPLRTQICAYAPKSCDRERTVRRWVAFLHPELRNPPPAWPNARWEVRRAKFAAMVLVAYQAYLGALPSACPGALHWGARWCTACFARMETHGLVPADCGLRNAWFRRP